RRLPGPPATRILKLPRRFVMQELAGLLLTVLCGQWDLRIHCSLWPACSVVGLGDRVTTEDQIERRIVLVHDALHKDHSRMWSLQYLLKIVAGIDDVGFCLLVTTEDIWQFRVAPVRNVVVLRILAQNGSLYGISRVLVQENVRLQVVPHDG